MSGAFSCVVVPLSWKLSSELSSLSTKAWTFSLILFVIHFGSRTTKGQYRLLIFSAPTKAVNFLFTQLMFHLKFVQLEILIVALYYNCPLFFA